jgi:hypothetical protein
MTVQPGSRSPSVRASTRREYRRLWSTSRWRTSIANALTPLRLTLDAAVADGLLDVNPALTRFTANERVFPEGVAADGSGSS